MEPEDRENGPDSRRDRSGGPGRDAGTLAQRWQKGIAHCRQGEPLPHLKSARRVGPAELMYDREAELKTAEKAGPAGTGLEKERISFKEGIPLNSTEAHSVARKGQVVCANRPQQR